MKTVGTNPARFLRPHGRQVRPSGFAAFTLIELAGGHRHHRHPCGHAAARPGQGQAEGAGHQCISNEKQLATAWIIYSGDNQDKLVLNYNNWNKSWVDCSQPGQGASRTNQAQLDQGLLWDNVKSYGVYKCPADISMLNNMPYLRSMSMNCWVGSVKTPVDSETKTPVATF
jgi:hypothetical protein